MIKTKNKKSTKQSSKKGYTFIGIGIALLMVIGGLAGYYIHTWQTNLAAAPAKTRLARINDIYKNLKLDENKYQLVDSKVFGDKRVYEWDAGRTYSSSKTYEHGADVNTTVSELRKDIEAAGFAYFEEPYPGSTFKELHFKSSKGEYIRLNVQSKPRFDALRNEILMNGSGQISDSVISMNPNAGPSKVVIKVNLDDNNE
jgi:hypothetical protein